MMNVIGQLKTLIHEAENLGLEADAYYMPGSPQASRRRQKLVRWMTNCEAIFEFAAIPSYSSKFHEVRRKDASDSWKIAEITGLLESASDMLTGGFIGNLRSLVQAEILDSVVDQADSLLKAGHILPAAVLGRIVLEQWLRDQAKSAGISEADTARASALNDKLKQAGKLSTPKWRQVQTGLDTGNAAAHGNLNEFSKDDVIRLLVFARSLSG